MGIEEREPDIHAPCRERIRALEAIVAELQKLLEEQLGALQARVVELEKENGVLKRRQAELEIQVARARKDSRPPDIAPR